jgi:hypothetical protein
MNRLVFLFAGASVWALMLAGAPAHAETLRCNGSSAAEGDSRVSVLYKCGKPLIADSFCAPVVYAQTLQPVPDVVAAAVLPCLPVEEWVYDRGPGNLVATVRFRAGIVQSIRYGRTPQ